MIYSTYEFNDDYKKKRVKLQEFLKTHNIKNINIVPYLKDLLKTQKLDFECDGHWNGETHKNISKYLKMELF